MSVPHSITLDITEITPAYVRGTLSGQFTYRKDGVGAGVLVTVTDASFDASNVVTRTPVAGDS